MVKKIGQRKFLLKRGYLESELDKMSPSEAKRIIASIEKIEHPQGQRKVYSEKEINAIKEFVEWLKVKYENERKAWYEIAKEKEQCTDEWEKSKAHVYFGRSYGFDRCATDLDQDFEDFIKEKENGR